MLATIRRFLRPGAALLPLLAGCAGEEDGPGAPSPADARPRNLILISIDTLRADHLGCYGYDRDTSPRLDALAEDGVVFENAVAESSWTIPSHLTMLTGLYPSTHGVELPTQRPSRATPLLAERLRDAGWYTLARTGGGWLEEEFGFGRGFLDFRGERVPCDRAVASLREALAPLLGKRPVFAFLHTYDVHCPYDPPEPHRSRFRTPDRVEIDTAGRCGNPDYNALDLAPGEVATLQDHYDGAIRSVDEALGELFAFLGESGALEHTVVVLTSDHGEEFHEYGRIGHEGTLSPEVLRVPLVIWGPDVVPGRIEEPAGLVDVVPTVIELLGIETEAAWEGRSWAARLRGEEPPGDAGDAGAYRYSELRWNADLCSWLAADHQVLVDRASGEARVLGTAGANVDPAAVHRRERERLDARRRPAAAPLEGPAPSGAAAAALAELGYAGD